MAGKPGRRGFGSMRRLPSKRWQATYTGPDGARHNAPSTFSAKDDAVAWLTAERRLIDWGEWTPPKERASASQGATVTFGAFAQRWLEERDLTPKTRATYRDIYKSRIEPTLAGLKLNEITPPVVRTWYAGLGTEYPTRTAHAYQLLRTILGTAKSDGLLRENPCTIPKAGRTPKRRELDLLTVEELDTVVAEMPARYRAAVLVAAWGGLRFGELTELRRKDVTGGGEVIRVRRAVTLVDGAYVVGRPKSDGGERDVHLPPHIIPALQEHMDEFTAGGANALVFTTARGGRVSQAAFTKPFKSALETIGRREVRVHDLRHFGAVAAAQAGATTKELMDRLGHSTPAMSMRYQHVAKDRPAALAARMSKLAEGDQSE